MTARQVYGLQSPPPPLQGPQHVGKKQKKRKEALEKQGWRSRGGQQSDPVTASSLD